MATTMKDLEGRLDAAEARLERLEGLTGHGTPAEAEVDEEAADRELLSRFPTTRDEALAHDAARARMAERGLEPPDYARDEDEAPEDEPAPDPAGA